MPHLDYPEAILLAFVSILVMSGICLAISWLRIRIFAWRARRAVALRNKTETNLNEVLFYRGRR
jgi:hypothetical protein